MIFFLVIFVVLFCGLYFFPTKTVSLIGEKKKLNVVCTISMITDVVKALGQDHIIVTGLMGPGIDPHLYKAREGDVHKLADADLIFFNGLHLEGKMGDVLHAMNKKIVTKAVAEVIPATLLIEGDFRGTFDPHVWHDVSLWLLIVQEIQDVLIKHDPEHAADYLINAKNYKRHLQDLDNYIKEQIQRLKPEQRILVTAHDAFHYFGKAYGFTVVGLQGISTDAEISTNDIQKLADYIVEKKVQAIFLESSIPERNIQAVQKAVQARNWDVVIGPELFSDALGDEQSHAETYLKMVKHNVDAIVKTLHKE
jgi:manganese/zinc/iron transport system substrate-binding protein